MIVVLFPALQCDGCSQMEFGGRARFDFSLSPSPAFQDINAYNCEEPTEKLPFPIIDDRNRDLAVLLGMLDPAEKDEKGMPVTARVVSGPGPGCRPRDWPGCTSRETLRPTRGERRMC